jgi:FMN reductase
LRPVLSSLDPLHVVNGLFLLDKQITVLEDNQVQLEPDVDQRLNGVLDQFLQGLKRVASAGI